MKPLKIKKLFFLPLVYAYPIFLYAADISSTSGIVDLTPEIIRQDQRLNELEKKLNNENILVAPQQKIEKLGRDHVVVTETPCFEIKQLQFIINDPLQSKNQNIFNGLFYDLNPPKFVVGQCIGTQSLQNLVKYAQNELIKQGLITTQIVVNPQDLTQGNLLLNIHVGRIHQIISKDKSVNKIEIFTALPIKNNEILNLKNIDQGLENLKRTSNREVDIKIEPAVAQDGTELVGYSDLIVTSRPYKKLGLSLGVDNSGSKNTGQYIGSLGISLNNPLLLNDALNINLSHSLDDWKEDFNQSFYINYSIPFRNYELSATHNEYKYEQKVAGFNAPILYSGKTKQSHLTLSRMISRGAHHKTSFYTKGYHKENQNFIENLEIGVQRRETAGWNAGIQHRQYIGHALLDLNLDYRRGTGALGAQSAPEERIVDINGRPLAVEGYARAPLWSADVRYSQPFRILNHPVQYRLNWRGQFAPKILVPQDRFYIGGRYSVRGFDGELMLSGDNGHYLQQELSWNAPIPATQFYAAIDQGWVNGRNSYSGQRHLIGSVLGTRSYFKGIYLDTFVGHGIVAPKVIKKEWVTGFSLNFSY
ncbi:MULTISPECIES: ShlB/FhaC/HecB family hemolysin secretion/activation protein [unclassified Acinetobacter]|nr:MULTISPECIES: ShlB/FhaC/HecB family hemolysin secretion/activation protein [unclassified Acinetobacter]MCW2251305.1 hemolysin activation/secretion protein [Acinetobacter sp. BIGb0204]NII36197.1 hemolysin activation/secretion protein [Acinetobacter sp. BIGb0196]